MVKRIVVAAIVLALCACKKDIPGIRPPDQYSDKSLSDVFAAFWSGMNTNYVFWSIDTTDWDRVYNVYTPKFARLDIGNTRDVDTAYAYFREMTGGLIDGHYQLSFFAAPLTDSVFVPSAARKERQAPLPFTFFSKTITQRYFSTYWWAIKDFENVTAGKTDTLSQGIVTGLIDQRILYLHVNCFYLSQLLNQNGYAILDTPWNHYLSLLHDTTSGLKGLIVDMRSNPGGLLDDMNLVVGQLIDSPLHFADTREKSGNGRLDYTPWAPAVATPQNGSFQFSRPIVVLTDQNTESMAEMTTMAIKSLPGSYIIGDTTWGANGPLNTNDGLYGGGQFSFANFGYVYTSSAEYRYIDGNIYEGKGFPPDQYLAVSPDAVSAGRDLQLESAIDYLEH
jgi:hypothetical protein